VGGQECAGGAAEQQKGGEQPSEHGGCPGLREQRS
jgi:hypothetical protein